LVVPVHAVSYFVSPAGDNNNDGRSQSSAWKTIDKVNSADFGAGDSLRFEGGKTFTGSIGFDASDAGEAGSPFVVGSFGTGRAVISNSGTALSVNGTNYIVVNNIDFVGPGYNVGSGSGVTFSASNHAIIDHVDITGFRSRGLRLSGSSNCRITYVNARRNGLVGIEVAGASNNGYMGYCKAIDNPGDRAITGNWSGSGILLISGPKNWVCEYCETANNGWDQGTGHGNGPVGGPWTWEVDSILMQYCIAHDNKTTTGDGGGFDLDGGTSNSTYQYCYSYGNVGGGFLVMTGASTSPATGTAGANCTIRYCISENDGEGGIRLYGGDNKGHKFYNNTIYNSNSQGCIRNAIFGDQYAGTAFYNNIFVTSGNGPFIVTDGYSDDGRILNSPILFINNCWYNVTATPRWITNTSITSIDQWRSRGMETLNSAPVGLYGDPMLTDPGKGEKLTDPTKLPELFAYMLKSGSPCINAGIDLKKQYSFDPGVHDFYANVIPSGNGFDIGAHEFGATVPNRVATPTFTPAPGTYSSARDVTIACATTGTQIRYTTDSTDPTSASTLYSAPITVSATTTIKAQAYLSGQTESSVALATYTIGQQTCIGGSIFTTQIPSTFETDSRYELGTTFKTSCTGTITKVRLYTNATEAGEHIVRLWRVSDKQAIAGPFTWNLAASAAGWKEFTLPAPVVVTENVNYIVAISNSTDKIYSSANNGLGAEISSGSLVAIAGGGVFSPTLGSMPDQSFENSSYFRDVVFEPGNFVTPTQPGNRYGAIPVCIALQSPVAPTSGYKIYDLQGRLHDNRHPGGFSSGMKLLFVDGEHRNSNVRKILLPLHSGGHQ
jgi:hypothetical protein